MKKLSAKNKEKKIPNNTSFNTTGIPTNVKKQELEESTPSITDLSENSLERFIGCGG